MNPNDPALDQQMKGIGAQIEAVEAQIAAALAADPPGDTTALEAQLDGLEDQMKEIQAQRKAHRQQVISDRQAGKKQTRTP